MKKELQVAIEAVIKASRASLKVFKKEGLLSLSKDDKSPVTVADFAAQAIITSFLSKNFPGDGIVGEEDSASLMHKFDGKLVPQVLKLVNDELNETLSVDQLCEYIDKGNFSGGGEGRFWALDPIDGTKGFLRGDQFAICLALISDGIVEVAALACPNLAADLSDNRNGIIYAAQRFKGAFRCSLEFPDIRHAVKTSAVSNPNLAKLCESFESGHSDHGMSKKICDSLGIFSEPIRMDSQCKYALIANGLAEIYMRFPTRPGYREKIWDHAAGYLIVKESGGEVTDIDGNDLDFTKGRYLESRGVLATNGQFHTDIINITKKL